MALFEGKTPAERNKLIAALAFGAVALFLLARMFFGSSPAPHARNTNGNRRAGATTARTTAGAAQNGQPAQEDDLLKEMTPVQLTSGPASLNIPDAGRNIFAYHVAPEAKKAGAAPAPTVAPTPTPEPPPPLTLRGVTPASVYARTGDFTLEVAGDKFTPEARVYLDGQELRTQFKGPQQLSANVPAALILAPGARSITVRTPDGKLYSNPATVNVAQPPAPPFTFVGIIGSPRYSDKAVLKNQGNELVTVQRGDLVGGRFRVTSISERAVEFTDAQLKIRHTLPYVEVRPGQVGPSPSMQRLNVPPPPKDDDSDDDDPRL